MKVQSHNKLASLQLKRTLTSSTRYIVTGFNFSLALFSIWMSFFRICSLEFCSASVHQENMTLMKILAERKYPLQPLCFPFLCLHIKCCNFNAFFHCGFSPLILVGSKLIEVNGIELQKMRINLQKAQQQNLQLAKENSSMLAVNLFISDFKFLVT